MTIAAPARARTAERDALALARAAIQRLLLIPVVRLLARPLVVRGEVPAGPVVFVANHASHADACVILAALPPRVRARTHPAAAADYFFTGRARAWLVTLVLNAFAFPRRGRAGLRRAERLLARGESVLLFPEGTRSTDGRIGRFRRGVGELAARGVTIVPVGVAGTREILPKGARVPARAAVVVRFGAPIRAPGAGVAAATARIERAVRRQARAARAARPARPLPIHERARTFARSPRALLLVGCWGFAEALVLPVVPDVPLVVLALAAPTRAPVLVLAALTGTLIGGAAAFSIGAAVGPVPVEHLPLVTERMADAVRAWFDAEGAGALARQPWNGVPFKAFGFQAAEAGVEGGAFLAHAALARGMRFAAVALAAAAFGACARPVLRWSYPAVVVTGLVAFATGLARVVDAWS